MKNHKNKLFDGLILSDSILSRIRTDAIKEPNLITIKLSYEFGVIVSRCYNGYVLYKVSYDKSVSGPDFVFSLSSPLSHSAFVN